MSEQRTPSLPAGAVAILATVAGGAIANNYTLQPSLGEIARDLGAPQQTISLAVSGLMFGYLAGLALLVPLMDHVSARRLMPLQLVALAGVLVAASFATSSWTLFACLLLVGAMATVAAQMSAIVGKLASSAQRGRQMGMISAGISAGILLSRLVGGLLSAWLGWRMMLACFAAFSCLAAVAAWATLPAGRPQAGAKFVSAFGSIPRLLAHYPELRRAALAGMLWFAAFSALWVGLAIELSRPPLSLSPRRSGSTVRLGSSACSSPPLPGAWRIELAPERSRSPLLPRRQSL